MRNLCEVRFFLNGWWNLQNTSKSTDACCESKNEIYGNICGIGVSRMKFLVTGGAGFIGSGICERLMLEGHAVWALDNFCKSYDPNIKRRNVSELQTLNK